MNKINLVQVIKVIGVVVIIAAIGLFTPMGSASSEVVNKNTLHEAYLAKSMDEYASCKNSLQIGKAKISQIATSYWTYDNMARVDDLEEEFVKTVEDKCAGIIEDYETNYAEYVSTSSEIENSTYTLFEKITGGSYYSSRPERDNYHPSLVQFTGDGSFVFTEQEVANYIETNLQNN